jgi:hypothetical protein
MWSDQAQEFRGTAGQVLRGNLLDGKELHRQPLAQNDIFLAGVSATGEHVESDPSPVRTDLIHHPGKLKDSGQPGLLEQFAVGGTHGVFPRLEPSARRCPPTWFYMCIVIAVLHQHPPGTIGENNDRDLAGDLHRPTLKDAYDSHGHR